MASRLDDIPVYEQRPVTVAATEYNRVHIALNRLGEPLRIPLQDLRTLELILEHEAWIVVDTGLNDIPVMAWTGFQVDHRQTLHEPIPCLLKIYHAHALVISDKVTKLMQEVLTTRLAELKPSVEADRVVTLKDKKKPEKK